MKQPKHYSVLEVLNFSDVSLIFEFYTTKANEFITSDLSRLTGKNIVLTNETFYQPTYTDAILLKEYEAARSRYQLHIASQNYHSILPLIDEVTRWISENCECTYDTQLKVSLSFNHAHLDTLSRVSMMNPTRLVLKFDENFVYERFPEQKGSPYALSIKSLAPITNYINESEIERNINYILTTPYAKFYGIDFTNYTQGILECNYIGGKDYASKTKEIKDVLEYFIVKAYQSINEEDLNEFEKYEIKRITEGFDKIQMAFYDPEIFLKEFQNLKLYVDLKTSTQTLKTYWNILRTPIFEMIINGGLKEGRFNYDAQIGRFQLRNAKVGGTTVKDMDLVKCDLTGVFENCAFVGCNISKARLYNAKVILNNKISESYLGGVSINKENEISNCYVVNNEEIVNCDIIKSVIKFATPGKDINVDESSTIIVKEMPLPKKSDAVEIDEIRDYSWIKSMNKNEDKGYQNQYDRHKYLK
jgi:hypothetical protein